MKRPSLESHLNHLQTHDQQDEIDTQLMGILARVAHLGY